MSAPRTNVDTQSRRHRPALIGIAVAVILGAGFFLLNALTAVDEGPEVAREGPESPADAPVATPKPTE